MCKKYCLKCGGEGIVGGCPSCGKDKIVRIDYSDKDFIKKTTNSSIPLQYVGKKWRKKELVDSHEDIKGDKYFDNYVANLEKISSIFKEGNVPSKSAIIIAPKRFSKVTFAYSCMQYALAKGFTVAPLLDTIEAKRLKALMSDRLGYKLYGRYDAESYFSSEVCFITVTKLYTHRESYELLLELMDTRSRLGLSTFIISEFSIEEMSGFDRRGSFKKIYDVEGTQNSLRYPAIIQYSENFSNV